MNDNDTPEVPMRAIIVSIELTSGSHISVVFDRYGMNASLFDMAMIEGWSQDRTVAQAVSNALAAGFREYPNDRPVRHTVTTTD